MAARPRPSTFWERLVAEAADSSVAATARRHGVRAETLKWWRWRLRKSVAPRAERAPTLLPVVIAGGDLAIRSVVVEVAGIAMRVEVGTDPLYVAALARALRSTC